MTAYPVFSKVFISEFYRRHATLFLLIIGLGFGFMGGYEHMVLASFFTASPFLMVIPILIWVAYAILVERFNVSVVRADENEFLYAILLYPQAERLRLFALVTACQLLPVCSYGIFLMVVAMRNSMLVPLILVPVSIVAIITVTSLQLERHLKNHKHEKSSWWVTKLINARFHKSFVMFFPEWAARTEPITLAGTKVVGLLLLFATAKLYQDETYDVRLMGMAVVVTAYAQCNLAWHLHQFDNIHLGLIRNLPISLVRRTIYLIVILVIILSPELGMLVSIFPNRLEYENLVSLVLFLISVPILIYGFLYYKPVFPDRVTTLVFYASMTTLMLVLFSVPVWVLSVTNFVVGFFLTHRFYYHVQFDEARIEK
jgi:hypothetical protein